MKFLMLIAFFSFVITYCTHIQEIHSEYGMGNSPFEEDPKNVAAYISNDCKTGTEDEDSPRQSIEQVGDAKIGYIEVDDQGWLYPSKKQEDQIQVAKKLVSEAMVKVDKGSELLVMIFVHGWHHNANRNDCNVNEFRVMVERAQKIISQRNNGKVIGLYVGWRGESVDLDLMRYTTVEDRRNAAENVAKGSVRELFAEIQTLEQSSFNSPIKSVVIGHSFGGLIVYNGLSQIILTGLKLKPPRRVDSQVAETTLSHFKPWPDQVVLINPAFEASRFEILRNTVIKLASESPKPFAPEFPRLVSITASNDWATGLVYSSFRKLVTIFQGYEDTKTELHEGRRLEEIWANQHTVGYADRYITHTLCITKNKSIVATHITEPFSKSFDRENNLFCNMNNKKRILADDEYAKDKVKMLYAAGENSPVWVAIATSDIIDQHDGFLFSRKTKTLQPFLLDWIVCMNTTGVTVEKLGDCQSDALKFKTRTQQHISEISQ